MKKKILVSGSYGTGNVGDEVILERLLEQLKGHDLTVLSQGTLYTRKYFPWVSVIEQTPSWRFLRIVKDILKCRFSLLRARLSFLKALYRSDVFVVGGGGLFAELVPQVLEFYLHQIKWANLLRTKVVVLGVGVGPLRTKKGRDNLAKTFNKCVSGTLVRDQQSFDNLIDVGVKENFEICPDLAFLGEFRPAVLKVEASEKKRVIVNIYPVFSDASIWENAGLRHQSFLKTIKQTIRFLLDSGYSVEILPFGTHSDLQFCKKLSKEFLGDITVFEGESYKSIQDRFSGAYFSITMRFHAGLLSFLHGVPSLCIDQQFKTERLLTDMKLEKLLLSLPDGFHKKGNKDLEFEEIETSIVQLVKDRDETLKHVENYLISNKKTATKLIKNFLKKHKISQDVI